MILADTSVWIDHFRSGDQQLGGLLYQLAVLTHPFLIAELALGSLSNRRTTLALLDNLPAARVATIREVRELIERRSLYNRGIGLIDAHLIASVLITPAALLWTRDRKLRLAAEDLGIHAALP